MGLKVTMKIEVKLFHNQSIYIFLYPSTYLSWST